MGLSSKKFYYILFFVLILGCFSDKDNKYSESENKVFEVKNPILFDSTYPFNSANKIVIYSYPDRYLWDGEKIESGVFRFNNTVIKNGKLNFDNSKIKDKVTLNQQQSRNLFNILYNKKCEEDISYSCYDPRHLIVFYDVKDNATDYIEICFQCSNIHTSEKVPTINTCNKKMDLLSNLFKSFGVNYFGDFDEENKLLNDINIKE